MRLSRVSYAVGHTRHGEYSLTAQPTTHSSKETQREQIMQPVHLLGDVHSMTKVKCRLKNSRGMLIHLEVGTPACPVVSGLTATVRRRLPTDYFDPIATKTHGTSNFRFNYKRIRFDWSMIDQTQSTYDWATFRCTKILPHCGWC